MRFSISPLLRLPLLWIAGLLVVSTHAQPAAQANGTMRVDGLDFALVHFNPQWNTSSQRELRVQSGFPKSSATTWETTGTLALKDTDVPLSFLQTVTPPAAPSFRVDYTVKHPSGAPTRELSVQITLPLDLAGKRPLTLDGTVFSLPEKHTKLVLLARPVAPHTLIIPSVSGSVSITGTFGVLVQDQREWNDEACTIRLQFPLSADTPLTQTSLGLNIAHTPYRSFPVSLRTAANRDFTDTVAADLKGGWTDQGSSNDLSSFPARPLNTAGVQFDIIDPSTNARRAALVVGRSGKEGVPVSASLPVPEKPVWKNLYLLHAGAWLPAPGLPAGTLRARYTDGTETVHEVRNGRDIDNWWTPVSRPNAWVGWQGDNASSSVGLYVSRFPLEAKPLASIGFEAAGETLWMIAAVSGSPDDLLPFRPKLPVTIKADAHWAPYVHSLEIAPGGVFDFSHLADAPAGKHGPLVATPQGHFEFAQNPGERVRFWGVNLCFGANFLEPAEADLLAGRLAASGYNTVRFHHYDRDLVGKKASSSHQPDAAQLEKLDYLFAAMKRRGLYVNIDLFTIRSFSADEVAAMGLAPGDGTPEAFKALVPISDAAFEAWSRFARAVLTHRNPHTGLTWAEDPALIGICPVNEDTISIWINKNASVHKRYEDLFAVWWSDAANQTRFNGDRTAGFTFFIHDKQRTSDARMHAFLRSLGVKAPLTGANFVGTQALTFLREHYDYVDNHQYWDHPEFPEKQWNLPYGFRQTSATRAAAQTPRALMPSRIWGKPYVVSEFNYVKPNQYRAEGGVLMPAYASLQDWDAIYNFEYSSNRSSAVSGDVLGTFSIADDPIGLIADRTSALLFRRGDIAPARRAIGYSVTERETFAKEWNSFPDAFTKLGLVSRIGSFTGETARVPLDAVVTGTTAFDKILLADSIAADGSRFTSDTGQIELKPRDGLLKVVTPRSELFILPANASATGDRVSVTNGDTFATVAVISLDAKPLAESTRLLITHLTDSLATGTKFADQDRTLLETRGELPFLIKSGSADIHLRLSSAHPWKAWAVDATGRRTQELPLVRNGDAWLLSARTVTPEGTHLAYELAEK